MSSALRRRPRAATRRSSADLAAARRPGRAAFCVRSAHRVEQFDELVQLRVAQSRDHRFVRTVHLRVQAVEQCPASIAYETQHLPTVGITALPANEPGVIELIE